MGKYYAIAKGRKVGIFKTWSETESLVKGYPGAKYKSFKTLLDAQQYLKSSNNLKQTQPTLNNLKQIQPSSNNLKQTQPTLNNLKQIQPTLNNLKQIQPSSNNLKQIQPIKNSTIVTIYTDGSCIDKVGGYGFTTTNGQEFKGRVPYNPATNQISELYAIYKAIMYCNNKNVKDLTIYTDSKYSIGCLSQWYFNWVKNGWKNSKGEPVKNKELIKSIISVSSKINITYYHVKAHNGDKYNEIADTLANEGRSC